jgi:hypothetical protein
VSNSGDRPARAKAGATLRPPRRESLTQASNGASAQADCAVSPTAADDSGDREDVERPARERDDGGSIEST